MSAQMPSKSKGQHRFSLLEFTGCSSGSNGGLGWASILFIYSFMDDVTYIKYVEVCM